MAKKAETLQLEAALEPVVAFNKLVVKNAEAAFNLQLASLRALAEVGVKNLNAGLDIANPADFRAYAEQQKDVAQEVAARLVEDARAYADLNASFIEQVRVQAEQSVKSATETTKNMVEVAKAAA